MSVGSNREATNLPSDPKDWLLDKQELKELEDQLAEAELITDYDIPYTAGYSIDGFTVYIDKEVPQFLEVKSIGNTLKTVKIDIWKCFAVHETVEKSLEAEPYEWKYKFSHQVALRAERAYVQSIGADWNDYNKKTLAIVTEVAKRKTYPNIPANLDPAPYLDYEDRPILKQFPNAEKLLDL